MSNNPKLIEPLNGIIAQTEQRKRKNFYCKKVHYWIMQFRNFHWFSHHGIRGIAHAQQYGKRTHVLGLFYSGLLNMGYVKSTVDLMSLGSR